MLAPSWLQHGSSWGHVGPRSGSPAAPEPTQALPNPFPVASGPAKLPFVPYKTQHGPQKDSQTSNLDLHNPQLGSQKALSNHHFGPQTPNLDRKKPNMDPKGLPNLQLRPPQPPTLTPKHSKMGSQSSLPSSKSLPARTGQDRPGGMGRSLFEYIYV